MYKNIQDVLEPGQHTIKVEPVPKFDENKKPIQGTHQTGTTGKGGVYWKYSTRVNGERIYLNAWDAEQNEWFKTGTITVWIKTQYDKNSGQPVNVAKVLPPEYNGQDHSQDKEDNRKAPLPEPPPETSNVVRGQIATHLVAAWVSKEGLRVMGPEDKKHLSDLIDLCINPPQPKFSDEDRINVEDLPF